MGGLSGREERACSLPRLVEKCSRCVVSQGAELGDAPAEYQVSSSGLSCGRKPWQGRSRANQNTDSQTTGAVNEQQDDTALVLDPALGGVRADAGCRQRVRATRRRRAEPG